MTAGGTIGRDQLVGQVTDALKIDTTIRPFRIDIPEADLDDPELCPRTSRAPRAGAR